MLVVDEPGRIEDETKFGSPRLFLRSPAFGAPEARFLKDKSIINMIIIKMEPRERDAPLPNQVSLER